MLPACVFSCSFRVSHSRYFWASLSGYASARCLGEIRHDFEDAAVAAIVPAVLGLAWQPASAEELGGEEGFVDSDGVKIHYVTMGKGPLVVLIHGFPDFWYTWRAQMPELAKHFQVVAVDMRGYNKSDQPEGVENYKVDKLVGDIDAVVNISRPTRRSSSGHDWGGIVAWSYAMRHPDTTDKLVILNLPHPKGLARELANNPAQQKASQYAAQLSAA